MEAGRIIGVGMPERNANELFTFQVDDGTGKFRRNCEVRTDLRGETRIPQGVESRLRSLLSHNSDDGRRGHEPSFGESLPDDVYAKEMVAMAMGCIDRCQILSTFYNGVRERAILLNG